MKMVENGIVEGDLKVIVEDGKAQIDYEDGLKVWNEFQAKQ